jgi:hypothetical protein
MADTTDTANVIFRPPIAWAVAVLGEWATLASANGGIATTRGFRPQVDSARNMPAEAASQCPMPYRPRARHVASNGASMSIDDDTPDGGETAGAKTARPNSSTPMPEALDAELRRESDDAQGSKVAILALIARKLAAKALDGDLTAIKEIFDRMDGKSVAGSAADEPPGKVVFEWKDPE